MLPPHEGFTLRLQARSKAWSNVSERGNLKNMLRSRRSTIHHLSQLCMAFSPARTHLEVSQAAAAPYSGCTPCASPNVFIQTGGVARATKEALLQQRACVLWFTGLSGSGKTTVATAVEQLLAGRGVLTALLDGDNMRHGLCCDLGFSLENREENIRRTSEVARMFVDCGVVTLACFISPYRRDRARARSRLEPGDFVEVYMKSPLDLCEERDPKGLYKLARQGKIKCFTGIDDPYEAPENPEITLDAVDASGRQSTPEEMAATVVAYLEQRGHISAPPVNNAVPHGKRGMQALDRRAKQMLDTAEVL